MKRLAIMDQDGANVRMLTSGRELVITPRFSPTSLEITYMTYTRGNPRVVLMNIGLGTEPDRRRFPGNVVCAPVLAGWAADRHEPG